jgi:hypothetical protein
MKSTLKAGIVLGLAVMAWTFIYGFAGWQNDPSTAAIWYVVILVQGGVLAWGLTLTKAEGKMYGGQLGAGTLMSVYGAVIGIFSSLLYTTVVFPDSLELAKEMQLDALAEAGQSAEQIEAATAGLDLMFTPAASAIMGFIMTILTGFVLSLILAAFIRNKA